MAPTTKAGGSKRPAPAPAPVETDNAQRQKRAKVRVARSIAAQPAEAALQNGELNLEAFVAARRFEMDALERSMAASKAVSSSRAFQKVPRGLRRRTASHNPKRVPRRLRARAKREMGEDNTPTVEARRRKPGTTRARIRAETAKRLGVLAARNRKKEEKQKETPMGDCGAEKTLTTGDLLGRKPRPKIRRNRLNNPPKPSAKFRRRQINKTWLPTHAWHAKRSRMTSPKEPLWRFAIPLTPNEKIYRPTHRAQGHRGAMVWDMTYISTIGVYGNAAGMRRVLTSVGLDQETLWNSRGSRWRSGTRAWTGMITRTAAGSSARSVCPATVIWDPEPTNAVEDEARQPDKTARRVWVRVPPAAFLEVFDELLRRAKNETPQLYIEDLRFEIGSIDITGPASTETLLAILKPYHTKVHKSTAAADLFTTLDGLTNSATLPSNAVLGFNVQDPRLHYPPKRSTPPNDEDSQMRLLESIADWPIDSKAGPHALFDRDLRHRASCLPSQKSISKRRTLSEPGKPLKCSASDPPIPIILHASRTGQGRQSQGTWTLLAPWQCILPIWYSIVNCPISSGGNPRFGGLHEQMQVAFERGQPWFPADFVGTDAGAYWELDQRKKREWEWNRRPKNKRTAWESLDLGARRKGEIGEGLACDFELLFGLPRPVELADAAEAKEGQQSSAMAAGEGQTKREKKRSPLKRLRHISKAAFNKLVAGPASPSETISQGVINVRISVISRGVVGPCARVYRLPPASQTLATSSNAEVPATIPPASALSLPHDLRRQWLSQVPTPSRDAKKTNAQTKGPTDIASRKRRLAQQLIGAQAADASAAKPNTLDIGGHPLVSDAEDLVGFVTTGSYCLSEGKGVAFGCLAAEKVVEGLRAVPREGHFCIVRNAGENVGWLARWEVL